MCKDCEEKREPLKMSPATTRVVPIDSTRVKLIIALLCVGIAYFLLIDVVY